MKFKYLRRDQRRRFTDMDLYFLGKVLDITRKDTKKNLALYRKILNINLNEVVIINGIEFIRIP